MINLYDEAKEDEDLDLATMLKKSIKKLARELKEQKVEMEEERVKRAHEREKKKKKEIIQSGKQHL